MLRKLRRRGDIGFVGVCPEPRACRGVMTPSTHAAPGGTCRACRRQKRSGRCGPATHLRRAKWDFVNAVFSWLLCTSMKST